MEEVDDLGVMAWPFEPPKATPPQCETVFPLTGVACHALATVQLEVGCVNEHLYTTLFCEEHADRWQEAFALGEPSCRACMNLGHSGKPMQLDRRSLID